METKSLTIKSSTCKSLGSYPTYEEWKQEVFFNFTDPWALFLSYLRGMETIPNVVPFSIAPSFLSYQWGNGNRYRKVTLGYPGICSYPTYEEWKLRWLSIYSFFLLFRSYPTYENGNGIIVTSILYIFVMFLSYLWGMKPPDNIDLSLNIYVLILPMRNGNRALFQVSIPQFLSVLITPMKNWN